MLHKKYKEHQRYGEWFDIDPLLIAIFIDEALELASYITGRIENYDRAVVTREDLLLVGDFWGHDDGEMMHGLRIATEAYLIFRGEKNRGLPFGSNFDVPSDDTCLAVGALNWTASIEKARRDKHEVSLYQKIDGYKDALETLKARNRQLEYDLRKANGKVEEYKKRRNETRNPSGYVYLLRAIDSDGLYKIGRTRNPDNRLRTFSVKLPFRVEFEHLIATDDMYALESDLHTKYTSTRQRGSEFFRLTAEQVAEIKEIALDMNSSVAV